MEVKRTCEVCGNQATARTAACGHRTYLCDTCVRECPNAMKQCLRCEGWRRRIDAEHEFERRRLAKEREAELLARAIHNTRRRAKRGYISYRTAADHIGSLLGTARHKRVLGRVRRLLGDTR